MKERRVIKEMPDRETLEEYMNPQDGVNVSFNIIEGKFEWIGKDDRPKHNNSEQRRTVPRQNS